MKESKKTTNENGHQDAPNLSGRPSASRPITVKQFASTYEWPSESALRSYIYRAEELGLELAFVRVGRRVLIRPDIFFQLIEKERA